MNCKNNLRWLAALGMAAALYLGNGMASAQDAPQRGPGGPGGGNFDPEQMRLRMMERMREQFAVKDDEEWKLISERIAAVTEARRAVGGGGGGMMFGGGPGGPGGRGPGGAGGGDGGQGGGPRGGGFGGGGPGGPGMARDAELEALRKAIEAKASPDEIKAKLGQLRVARKEKEAKLEKAQEALKEVLSANQEAVAVMMGLLK